MRSIFGIVDAPMNVALENRLRNASQACDACGDMSEDRLKSIESVCTVHISKGKKKKNVSKIYMYIKKIRKSD